MITKEIRKKEIKKWLIDKDLTMQGIADRTRVDVSLVSYIISGGRGRRQGPKTRKVLRLMKRLGCPQEFLEAKSQQA